MGTERTDDGMVIKNESPAGDVAHIDRIIGALPDSRHELMVLTIDAIQTLIDDCGFRLDIATLVFRCHHDADPMTTVAVIRKLVLLESAGVIIPRNDRDGYTVDGWEIADKYLGAFMDVIRTNRKDENR